jgi:ubiquinone/menaquinone biosynthesis C-methylase UbiE
MTSGEVTDRLRSLWERYAPRYDRDTGFFDLLLLGDSRSWACSQASGRVLEVAIGTGRNLPFYARGIQLTGVDFSPAMLDIARGRAAELAIDVTLIVADAQHLPLADDRFNTVVCTLALSSIPDTAAAINEMRRVLRPGGHLLVVGHVASPYRVVRAGQRRLERLSIRLAGDHQTRQPYPEIVAAGFTVDRRERLRAGVIERVRAVKPADP